MGNGSSRVRTGELLVRYLLLTTVLVITIGPLMWQFTTSLKGKDEDIYGPDASLLPSDPSLDAYDTVWTSVPIPGYVSNSLTLVLLSLTSQLVLATAGGYMLSRPGWRGRGVVFMIIVSTIMIPFESIMVSLFLAVRDLGLLDTIVGVWLPGISSVVNILLMRAAFMAVPRETEEAALLDGASEWQRFRRIFLPSAKGALAVVSINTVIGAWDEFLWPLLVLTSEERFTLPLGLARLQDSAFGVDERMVMAGAMISVIPIIILFFATQRYFYKGVEAGAVKL